MTMRCDVIMHRVIITLARHHVGIATMHCDARRNSRGGVHHVERTWSR
jgi:hypothetical protein